MCKRFFYLFFVAFMVFALAGCGEEETINGPGDPETEKNDDNPDDEDEESDDSTDDTTDDDTPGDDQDDDTNPSGEAVAFPGAEGGGMYTTGGRGGAVFVVTSLEDGVSEGTLRYAVGQSGARTIVFAVAGTIYLNSELKISNGDLTIAGQSAPGGGITLANYPITINAENIIIRFLRFRMGDQKAVEGDAIWGRRHADIILDHCSMSWSTDECASFYDNENFTMQWCLIAESLNESVHGKGAHGYGGLWGGYNATFHHNLLAHHKSRNPRFYGVRDGIVRERAEMVNNVIYNWGSNSSYGGEAGEYNIVNNYYKAGPATKSNRDRIFEAYYEESYGKFFLSGNYVDGYPSVTNDNWLGFDLKSGGDKSTLVAASRFDIIEVNYTSAEEAYTDVLEHVGASLSRDVIDERIVGEVTNGDATYGGTYGESVGIIDTQATVGGWPDLDAGTAPVDSDKDGMSDEWESQNSLNPNDATDAAGNDIDESYTNLEMYLNEIIANTIGFGL
jgi:pectate lyase/predicted small lipoprotein YifL